MLYGWRYSPYPRLAQWLVRMGYVRHGQLIGVCHNGDKHRCKDKFQDVKEGVLEEAPPELSLEGQVGVGQMQEGTSCHGTSGAKTWRQESRVCRELQRDWCC